MRLGKCVDSIGERQTVEAVIFVNGRRSGAAEFKAGIRRKNAIESIGSDGRPPLKVPRSQSDAGRSV